MLLAGEERPCSSHTHAILAACCCVPERQGCECQFGTTSTCESSSVTGEDPDLVCEFRGLVSCCLAKLCITPCFLLFLGVHGVASGEVFGHNPVEILVSPSSASYMLTSFGFPIWIWGIFSKVIGGFPEVLNFNRLFPKLNRFICD